MPLTPGTRLGPYEILSALGAGGMGEVYRARDTRLGREVAIKILPELFAADADRVARFQREAQVLASLNHPHIASIYGLEEGALILELVDGPTLADRIAQGPIPLDEALPIARQIAQALEAAHERGIIHRDLKPANIKLTSDGTVKVLDFGLAKALDTPDVGRNFSSADALANSPTITSPAMATHAGVILGTAAYMSPEQAKGKPVDRRSDMWAFGCVLFEMLTGKRAFAGDDVSDTLAEILKGDPEWAALPAQTPPAISKLLRRCLAKDRKARLSDAAVAQLEIEDALTTPVMAPSAISAPRPTTPHSRERLAWLLLAATVILAVGVAGFSYLQQGQTAAPAYRASLVGPPDTRIGSSAGFGSGRSMVAFAISPDGRHIAFLGTRQDAQTLLWLRSLDSVDAKPLPGTEGATGLFWSPDNRTVGFFATGKLQKVDISGGAPVALCDASPLASGTWSADDVILFGGGFGARPAIYRVSASGGEPTAVTSPDEKAQERHGYPSFLPDGRHFLYVAATGASTNTLAPRGLFVGSLDSAETKLVLPTGSRAEYAQKHLVFLRESTLLAQPFDATRLELKGDPTAIGGEIALGPSGIGGAFSVSQSGPLAYQTGSRESPSKLVWFDRGGGVISTLADTGDFSEPELSPDGRRAAVAVLDSTRKTRDVWLYDLASRAAARFTVETPDAWSPRWSGDGAYVLFSSSLKGHRDIYLKASSGAGSETVVYVDELEKLISDVSRDGRHLLYQTQGATGADLFVRPISGEAKSAPFMASPKYSEFWGRFSPDGRWIAYYSDLTGRREVWVARFPADGSRWQISTTGGWFPRWRRDGRELFYLGLDNKLYAVAVNGNGSAFEFGVPEALFETQPRVAFSPFDVTADGQRFLVSTLLEQRDATPITLVVNWLAGLGK